MSEEITNVPPSRPPVRPETAREVQEPREMDPRERAMARVAALQGTINTSGEVNSRFDIPLSIIPPAWTYEWKRMTVLGKEDPSYQVNLAQRGWEAVPASRHPELMPVGWKGKTIDIDGMRLMEIPTEIVQQYILHERKAARSQVAIKEEQLSSAPSGQFDRVDGENKSTVRIKRSYEAMPVMEG